MISLLLLGCSEPCRYEGPALVRIDSIPVGAVGARAYRWGDWNLLAWQSGGTVWARWIDVYGIQYGQAELGEEEGGLLDIGVNGDTVLLLRRHPVQGWEVLSDTFGAALEPIESERFSLHYIESPTLVRIAAGGDGFGFLAVQQHGVTFGDVSTSATGELRLLDLDTEPAAVHLGGDDDGFVAVWEGETPSYEILELAGQPATPLLDGWAGIAADPVPTGDGWLAVAATTTGTDQMIVASLFDAEGTRSRWHMPVGGLGLVSAIGAAWKGERGAVAWLEGGAVHAAELNERLVVTGCVRSTETAANRILDTRYSEGRAQVWLTADTGEVWMWTVDVAP